MWKKMISIHFTLEHSLCGRLVAWRFWTVPLRRLFFCFCNIMKVLQHLCPTGSRTWCMCEHVCACSCTNTHTHTHNTSTLGRRNFIATHTRTFKSTASDAADSTVSPYSRCVLYYLLWCHLVANWEMSDHISCWCRTMVANYCHAYL
jgi:hypothetical protein